jgi:hypothetical protein
LYQGYTGVISNFQNARQETTLNAIELNTRITSILLGSIDATGKAPQDAENLKTWTKFTGMTVGEIKTALYSVIHSDLVGIWGAIGAIPGGGASALSVDFGGLFEGIRVGLLDVQNGVVAAVTDVKTTLFDHIHSDLAGIASLLAGGNVSVSPTVNVSAPAAELAANAPVSFDIGPLVSTLCFWDWGTAW